MKPEKVIKEIETLLIRVDFLEKKVSDLESKYKKPGNPDFEYLKKQNCSSLQN